MWKQKQKSDYARYFACFHRRIGNSAICNILVSCSTILYIYWTYNGMIDVPIQNYIILYTVRDAQAPDDDDILRTYYMYVYTSAGVDPLVLERWPGYPSFSHLINTSFS